jgi:5-methyltetrahydrofolate--homocysteine methyltransferase
MSALLTTTMGYMKTVIDRFKEEGLGHIPIAVGGAPVSQTFADEAGAAGYAADASAAVALFETLCPRPSAAADSAAKPAGTGPSS